MEKIQQLMPAPGWKALFAKWDDINGLLLTTEPLLALVNDGGAQFVEGIVRGGDAVYGERLAGRRGFVALLAPGEDPEEFRSEAEEYVTYAP